ncbi:MAG: LCP family protein [Ruminiclostridium sp.]|nr:LCP family protein [Ruminiclostridium sp.]
MRVRRKSNWYIYLIALVVSFVLLGLFVRSIWGSIFPEDGEGAAKYALSRSDYRPSADINITTLIMLSDMKAATPMYYMLMNYQPRNEVIVFIPLRENMRVDYGGNTGSLYEMYDNYGAKAVAEGIEGLLGIKCEHYIKFDRLSFIDFIDMGGAVYVNIPSDVVEKQTRAVLKKEIVEVDGVEEEVTRQVAETTETVVFPEGTQYMSGEKLYSYLTYDFKRGVDYPLAIQGSAAMNMINRNFRGMSSTQMQSLAEAIIKTTETDIVFDDYTTIQAVFNYTLENSINPCEYYIPYGETDGGYFILSDGAKSTMLDRMSIKPTEKK